MARARRTRNLPSLEPRRESERLARSAGGLFVSAETKAMHLKALKNALEPCPRKLKEEVQKKGLLSGIAKPLGASTLHKLVSAAGMGCAAEKSIAAVDTKAHAWRTIGSPSRRSTYYGIVSHSQGCLIYVQVHHRRTDAQLVIYALEDDHDSEEWTLRNRVTIDALFGPEELPYGLERLVVAVHPNCDRCFFYDRLKRLMSCDMKEGRVHVICTLEGVDDYEIHPFF